MKRSKPDNLLSYRESNKKIDIKFNAEIGPDKFSLALNYKPLSKVNVFKTNNTVLFTFIS